MSKRLLEIPNFPGWTRSRLGELCELISRGTAPLYVDDSPVLAIGQRCVRNDGFDAEAARPHDRRFRKVLRAERGDVLLNSTGTGTIGRSCVFDAEGDFMVDGHVTVLRAAQTVTDPTWLNAVLRSAWGQRHLESHCFTGSTNQVELSRSELWATELPVPSIGEQRRIAEILDALDAEIANVGKLLAKFALICEVAIYSEISKLSQFLTPLGDAATVSSGSTPSRANPAFWNAGTIPWVKTGEVAFAEIWEVEESITEVALKAARLKVYPPGTVLVAMYGEGVTRGRSAMLRVPATVNQACAAISPISERLLSEFLAEDLRFKYEEIRDMGQGSNQSNLNAKLLLGLKVTCPPISDQRKIVDIARSFDRQLAVMGKSRAKLELLRRGVAEDLLTGRVRV